jgi:hypothetical protein
VLASREAETQDDLSVAQDGECLDGTGAQVTLAQTRAAAGRAGWRCLERLSADGKMVRLAKMID